MIKKNRPAIHMYKWPFLLLLFLSFTAHAQVDLQQIDRYFTQMQRAWDVPGMSVGIVKEGKLIFNKGYGTLKAGSGRTPDGQTLYAIASNSKAFTASILAALVQEGKLSWTDKVRDYLPYFKMYDQYVSEEVTIEDLLCHRAGLGTFSGDVIWYKSELTAKEIIERLPHLRPAYDFRAGYGYSNLMYVTAGEVIRAVTGKSWADNVSERFLNPLNMGRTQTGIQKIEALDNVAQPHARQNDENVPIAWTNWDAVGATGGLISSVEDVASWMIFNMNHGIWQGDTVLAPASWNKLWTPHNNFVVNHISPNALEQNFSGYGLGWGISDYRGHFRVGHTGGYDGMISAVTMLPDEKLGVVVLTNGVQSPIMAATYYALDAMLGVEPPDWSEKLWAQAMQSREKDTRVADARAARKLNTQPSLPIEAYQGHYKSDIYGLIEVGLKENVLQLSFEHSPALGAQLKHWHYDVWEIVWDEPQAWFEFGTLKFDMDNNLNITGLSFFVPNDDIFFEELKPVRISVKD
jgi:CubicO group peptidase (beta-lactamase class C family)